MGWNYLAIFFALSLVVCLCGFKKYVYFMSIGYGFSVAIIGVAMAVMSLCGVFEAKLVHYIQFVLFVIYGIRLSGFLLIREIKNASYRKTLQEATGDESKMPIFVKVAMWLVMGVLYTLYLTLINNPVRYSIKSDLKYGKRLRIIYTRGLGIIPGFLLQRERELTFRMLPLFVILLIFKISPFYRYVNKVG